MLSENKIKEISDNNQIYSFFETYSCWMLIFDYFKLWMLAFMVFLYVIVKIGSISCCFFDNFYDFFCRQHSLMNQPCYNNLFQFMQRDNLRNLSRVVFTHRKHLQFSVNVFWYYFPVIKQYKSHYLMKSARFQETRALSKYCNCVVYVVIKV